MAKLRNLQKQGSVGPSTFQNSPHGTIERVRAQPVDPHTRAQQNQRALLSNVSSQWRGLTDEQREAWKTLAVERAGHLTGSQTYNQVNAVLVQCGLPTVPMPPAVPVFGKLSCAGLLVEETPRLVLRQVSLAGGADRVIIAACHPMGQGISNVSNRFRFLLALPLPAEGPVDLDFTAAYIERFEAPLPGKRVFVRVGVMKSGFKSTPLQLSAITPADGA